LSNGISSSILFLTFLISQQLSRKREGNNTVVCIRAIANELNNTAIESSNVEDFDSALVEDSTQHALELPALGGVASISTVSLGVDEDGAAVDLSAVVTSLAQLKEDGTLSLYPPITNGSRRVLPSPSVSNCSFGEKEMVPIDSSRCFFARDFSF